VTVTGGVAAGLAAGVLAVEASPLFFVPVVAYGAYALYEMQSDPALGDPRPTAAEWRWGRLVEVPPDAVTVGDFRSLRLRKPDSLFRHEGIVLEMPSHRTTLTIELFFEG
jgi:hypothetical protein